MVGPDGHGLGIILIPVGSVFFFLFTKPCPKHVIVELLLQNNFVVFSLLQQQVVIKVACGGGNRSWDCGFADDHQMVLFYIKSRDVVCCQATIEDKVTIIQVRVNSHQR